MATGLLSHCILKERAVYYASNKRGGGSMERTSKKSEAGGSFRHKVGRVSARLALIGTGAAAILTGVTATEVVTNTGTQAHAEGPNGAEKAWCRWPSRYALCFRANSMAEDALEAATGVAAKYGRQLHNGDADGFRHCYWNARMTEAFGAETAQGFGDRHEYNDSQDPAEAQMDLYNNAVGRQIAVNGKNPYDGCLNAMLNNELAGMVPYRR